MYKIYGKKSCMYCDKAKLLLDIKGIAYEYVDIQEDEKALEMMKERGYRSVPQIFHGCSHIGGYFELAELLKSPKMPTEV